jgi:hypothetical protein
VVPGKTLTLVCRGDVPILVCMEEALRVTDCGTVPPRLEGVDVRELAEGLRAGGLLCGGSDDIAPVLEL